MLFLKIFVDIITVQSDKLWPIVELCIWHALNYLESLNTSQKDLPFPNKFVIELQLYKINVGEKPLLWSVHWWVLLFWEVCVIAWTCFCRIPMYLGLKVLAEWQLFFQEWVLISRGYPFDHSRSVTVTCLPVSIF